MRLDDAIIYGPGHLSRGECEVVLRSLPEWFGIEEALLRYASDAETMPTFAASHVNNLIGFLTIKRHFAQSAEVHVVAVHRNYHHRGVGTRLFSAAEEWLRQEGVRLLGVKTLSASSGDPYYARTHQFYLSRGFESFEEMPQLWNEANPCLIMVKCLAERPHNPPTMNPRLGQA